MDSPLDVGDEVPTFDLPNQRGATCRSSASATIRSTIRRPSPRNTTSRSPALGRIGSRVAAYDSYGEKRMFGKTFDGVFRNTCVVGPDGRIERTYEGASPEGHAVDAAETDT